MRIMAPTELMRPKSAWKFDHVCILVTDVEEGCDRYCRLFGINREKADILRGIFDEQEPGTNKPTDVQDACLIPLGESFLELIQPLNPKGQMMKDLQSRGERLHHISFIFPGSWTPDFRTRIYDYYKNKGYKPLGDPDMGFGRGEHVKAADARRWTYLHPKYNTHGVLIEILPKCRYRPLRKGDPLLPGEMPFYNYADQFTDTGAPTELLDPPPSSPWRIDHVSIAVNDLDDAIERYCEIIMIDPQKEQIVRGYFDYRDPCSNKPVDEVEIANIPIGDCFIQLLKPVNPEGQIAKDMKARGEGLHHVAFSFPGNWDAETVLADLQSQGFKTMGNPKTGMEYGPKSKGAERRHFTYLYPKVNTNGCLFEIAPRTRFRKMDPDETNVMPMEVPLLGWGGQLIH